MGQVALGFRSLFVKLTIFVIMAALLAWALGGTLWPKPRVVDFAEVHYIGESSLAWRLEVSGENFKPQTPEVMVYRLMLLGDTEPFLAPYDETRWSQILPLLSLEPGIVIRAGQRVGESDWRLERAGDPDTFELIGRYPDRFTAMIQLERLRNGFPAESPADAARRRDRALANDPATAPAQDDD